MSTVFCKKLVSCLHDSKHFSIEKSSLKTLDKSLTGPWVSKTGRPDLYRQGSYGQVIQHVFDRLDAPQAQDWYLDRLSSFPDESERDRFDRRAGESPGLVSQPRLTGAVVDGQGRVGVGNGQGVRSGVFRSPGDKSNVCNKRGELDPEGSRGCGFSGGSDELGDARWIAAELHAPPLDVGAGDVQLVA